MDPNIQTCFRSDTSASKESPLAIDQILYFLKAAADSPGKGPLATAAMLIVMSHRLNRSQHILLTPRTLKEFNLSRAIVYRSLLQLEALELVTVRRQKGRGPQITFCIAGQCRGG